MMPSGNWSWTDGTSFDFNNWAKGEPKNITGNDCATLTISDGYWQTNDCFIEKPYICKVAKNTFEPSPTYPVYAYCPYPFIYFEPSHSCYGNGNMTGPLDWTTAEKYCEAFGGHLPSVHSKEEAMLLGCKLRIEHTFFYTSILDNVFAANSDFWTGAYSNDGGNTWKWSDGTKWDYNPWAQTYPFAKGNSCGVMWGGAIANFPCTEQHRPICKKSL